MNELIEQLRKQWSTLDSNDQTAIRLGVIMVSVLLFLGLVIIPSYHSYSNLRKDVPGLHARLEIMEAQAHEAKRLRTNPSAQKNDESLLTLLEKTTTHHDIRPNVQSLTPRPNQSAAIRLKSIEYAKLVKWLAGLNSQYRLKASELELTHLDTHTAGVVDAFIVFKEPGQQ